jgi:hypothetical protein
MSLILFFLSWSDIRSPYNEVVLMFSEIKGCLSCSLILQLLLIINDY